MFSALLLVLGILMACVYLMRRLGNREGIAPSAKITKIMDRTPIGVKKNVTVIEVADRILVLGVTHDRISLLAQIEDQESVERITNHVSKRASTGFSSQLSRFLDKARRNDAGRQASAPQVTLN